MSKLFVPTHVRCPCSQRNLPALRWFVGQRERIGHGASTFRDAVINRDVGGPCEELGVGVIIRGQGRQAKAFEAPTAAMPAHAHHMKTSQIHLPSWTIDFDFGVRVSGRGVDAGVGACASGLHIGRCMYVHNKPRFNRN